MSNRRGASLIELLVVITTSMIVVGLAVAMVRSLLVANRTAEAHLVRSDTVRRLCDSFRSYVRAASAAECVQEDDAMRLELSLADGRQVVFRAAEQAVVRTESDATADRRREKYSLANGCIARFETHAENDATTVTLVIVQTPSRANEGPSREFRAEATLDRDRRFVTKGK